MKMIDISVMVGAEVPVWEGDERPLLTEGKAEYPRGVIQTTTVRMNVHTGTHIDAPRHFYPTGKKVPEIPLEKMNGRCQVLEFQLDLQEITRVDLIAAGIDLENKRLLLKTANSQLWKREGNVFSKKYTALGPSAAAYLVEHGINLVGIDYLSIAPFENVWDVHQILLSNEIVILEGVDLSDVEPGVYELICLPLKLSSMDGVPVRAVLRTMMDFTDCAD